MNTERQVVNPRSNPRVTANFQAEMERLGLPHRIVASKIGVSERQITRWRGGHSVPVYASVEKIAELCDREPEWFYLDHSDDRVAA